jgi:hypothetical protein
VISATLRPALRDAFMLPRVMGSDHCPVGAVLELPVKTRVLSPPPPRVVRLRRRLPTDYHDSAEEKRVMEEQALRDLYAARKLDGRSAGAAVAAVRSFEAVLRRNGQDLEQFTLADLREYLAGLVARNASLQRDNAVVYPHSYTFSTSSP